MGIDGARVSTNTGRLDSGEILEYDSAIGEEFFRRNRRSDYTPEGHIFLGVGVHHTCNGVLQIGKERVRFYLRKGA